MEKELSIWASVSYVLLIVCIVNEESLEVSFIHLAEKQPLLANFLLDAPGPMLQVFDKVAYSIVLGMWPKYDRIHPEVHVRITDLPVKIALSDLRKDHLASLICVGGVITRRTNVYPQFKWVKFECIKCGEKMGPFNQDSEREVKIGACSGCQSKGPFTIATETVFFLIFILQTTYRNFQRLTIQESPGSVPPGRLPRHREVVLTWDLVDKVRPGDEIV